MQQALPRTPDAKPRLVREGELRVAPLAPLPAILRERGVDPPEVFASAGLDIDILHDPDNPVPFATVGRVMAIAERRTGCAHIGLLVGERHALPVLGLVGRVARNSADVGSALRSLIAHLHLHDRGAVPTLWVNDGFAMLGYAIFAADVPGARHIYDAAIAIAFNIMREVCGADWRPDEVLIAHSAPRSTAAFRTFFKVPVRFDAEQTALVFPVRRLAQKIEGADAALLRILTDEMDELEASTGHQLPDRVRRALRALVTAGRGSRDEVSRLVSMHRRTLNRRLAAHGTTFQALADEVRFQFASQLLRDTRMPLAHIAATFDYADASAFTRAFRRWSGATPSEWRATRTGSA
jgi:AraC-like DNA-binding protein